MPLFGLRIAKHWINFEWHWILIHQHHVVLQIHVATSAMQLLVKILIELARDKHKHKPNTKSEYFYNLIHQLKKTHGFFGHCTVYIGIIWISIIEKLMQFSKQTFRYFFCFISSIIVSVAFKKIQSFFLIKKSWKKFKRLKILSEIISVESYFVEVLPDKFLIDWLEKYLNFQGGFIELINFFSIMKIEKFEKLFQLARIFVTANLKISGGLPPLFQQNFCMNPEFFFHH